MKNNLTIIVLAKDEESQIEECLKSAGFGGELVVIDTGSSDKTVFLAKKYTEKVLQVDFSDFAALRNLGKNRSLGDWVFYLDADESIPLLLKNEILETIQSKSGKSTYFVKRINYYLGKKWPNVDRMQRLFKKEKLINWYGKVHETPEIKGETGELANFLIHKTHNSLEEMLINTLVWSGFEAEARHEARHPLVVWWRIYRVMLTAFWESYVKNKGYAVGTEGLIEGVYQSFSIFITYAKLWELQQKNVEEHKR